MTPYEPRKIQKADVDKTLSTVYNRHTRIAYRRTMMSFVGKTLAASEVQKVVDTWMGKSKSTIIQQRAALAMLVKRVAVEGGCDRDVLQYITFPGGKPPVSRGAATQDEIDALFAAATTTRQLAILAILADTGLRVGTLRQITVRNLLSETFVVQTKRDRIVEVVCTSGLRRIGEIMQEEGYSPHDYVMARLPGRKAPTTRTIQRELEVLSDKAGVRVSAHNIRHSFATRLDNANVSISIIQRLMGHASMGTTAKYIHPERDAIRAAALSVQRSAALI